MTVETKVCTIAIMKINLYNEVDSDDLTSQIASGCSPDDIVEFVEKLYDKCDFVAKHELCKVFARIKRNYELADE